MLVSWLISSFTSQHNVCQRVSQRDLRLIAIQFCTHLLAANVIRKLEEEAASRSTSIFKVCKLLTSIGHKAFCPSCLEQSSTTCHIRTVTDHLTQSSENHLFRCCFPWLHLSVVMPEKRHRHWGHVNQFCYLLIFAYCSVHIRNICLYFIFCKYNGKSVRITALKIRIFWIHDYVAHVVTLWTCYGAL